jgi:AcrR family transcriptional regulator
MSDRVRSDGPQGKGPPRRYTSARRAEAAARTRAAILDGARRLFADQGYAATTVAAVAREAGVNVDTVYASIGPKPALFRLLIETAISGTGGAVPAGERDYVREIRAEPDAGRKLDRYARVLRGTNPRLAPLLDVVRGAAGTGPELAALWDEINERRAANMRLLARELLATGQLRPGLKVDEVATTLWLLAGSDTFLRLTRDRGWSLGRYERWLAGTWRRLFLVTPEP